LTSLNNEADAVEAFRNGDVGGLEWLATRYMRDAVAIARGLLKRQPDAEDVAQDAFVRAWKKREQFRTGERFGPWLNRIVTTIALDLLKHHRRRREEEIDVTHPVAIHLQPEAVANGRQVAERIAEAIDGLPPMQRTVASLFIVEELEHAEIAEMLALSEGTVRSHLSLARRRLRETLKEFVEN
jgi:RNA polymerase sigma-70 factor (ECF subfamily)